MPLWLVFSAVAVLAAGAAAVAFWDDLRGVIYRWLKDHGHTRAAQVFLVIEVIPGQVLRKVTTFVRPSGRVLSTRVEEREVRESDLPEEVRRLREERRKQRIEVTAVVMG